MTRRWTRMTALLLLLVLAFTPAARVQAAGTDEIKSYTIDILPQPDGSLVNTYAINWCVISNSAGPLSWFTVGMPNEQYQIMGSSGDVSSVIPYNEGFDYKIRIDLPREVYADECVNASVQVRQYGMAYLDATTSEISFQFTPGWFDEVPVDLLQVTWHLPSEAALLKSLDPQPSTQDGSQAVWKTALQPGDRYPITIIYDKAAFPNFNPSQAAPTQAPVSIPTGSGPYDSSSPTDEGFNMPIPGITVPFTFASCLCMCLIAIVVLFILFAIIRSIGSAGRSYRGGGYFGGYPRGGGWTGGGGGGSIFKSGGGGGGGFTPRIGGGSGSFGGRGMSCACVSSGCACACAGGGRAGCSRKGFDVSGLFKNSQAKPNP
jgi:hypothetical protein